MEKKSILCLKFMGEDSIEIFMNFLSIYLASFNQIII